MADILIINGIVVTMDGKRRVIEDGAVAITGDRIVAVGATAQITAKHSAPKVIDASRKIVMPGFIDAHAHAGHGFIKTLGAGRSDLWYEACGYTYTQGSTPEFWRAEAQLAALERLRFGVTTGVSLLGGGDTILRTDDPIYGDAHCDGVKEVGTRSFVAVGSTRPPHPLTYGSWSGKNAKTYPVTFEQQYATCETLIKTWHGKHGQRINIALITPTLREEHRKELSAGDMAKAIAQAKQVSALARANGLVFTQDGHAKGSVAFAKKMGILGPEALLSHSTGLTKGEISICADTDTKIAHNPSAIASVLARCPAIELMDAGVTVALGSDATAPDRNGDMFRHMQQAMHYHKTFFKDPKVLPAGKALEMCTIDGARALGMEKEIGSLEKGKKADIALVDLARPHMYPLHMPVFRLVHFANGNDVTTVIVDGKILMEDRVVASVNETRVLEEAQKEAEMMLDRGKFRPLLKALPSFWGHTRQ
ncbi:MAG: amidohydrolase family protein [Methylocystis sp.]|nr:amidohydrolase family protein [Methylocystis sp.]MCA3587838.1 amidohydrolase family protein [Methylocystis sp.]MCA3590830.1 amidohydrolase family protein [Methylocystis sp.]